MSNVKSYTDKQLLDKVSSLSSFKEFPKGYWLLGIQSDEDKFNTFDDKFYLFKGKEFVLVTSGTTNAGKSAIEGFEKYNKLGVAVIKTNEWYYDLWQSGLHKGKMQALRQISPIKHYRDNNKNTKIEEIGEVYNKIIYCNFHTNSYDRWTQIKRFVIGGWSACCQVCNDPISYYKILELIGKEKVSYCLLKEF
jgi:hypothetical protein